MFNILNVERCFFKNFTGVNQTGTAADFCTQLARSACKTGAPTFFSPTGAGLGDQAKSPATANLYHARAGGACTPVAGLVTNATRPTGTTVPCAHCFTSTRRLPFLSSGAGTARSAKQHGPTRCRLTDVPGARTVPVEKARHGPPPRTP